MYGSPHNMPGPGDEETWGPCTNHPMDPRTPEAFEDSDEAQELKHELYEKRVKDIDGYLPESFTEAARESLTELAAALVDEDEAQIGFVVMRMVKSYCWPSLDDIEQPSNEPDEPEPDLCEEYDDDYEPMGGHY